MSSDGQRLQDQPGPALRQSGHFIAETKVNYGAIAADPYPGIGLLQAELAPLQFLFAQESEPLLNEGTCHQGPHRTAQIQTVKR